MIHPISKRKLTVGQQLCAIRRFFPDVRIRNKNGNLSIFLYLQPTPMSRFYPIEIKIHRSTYAEVWLVGNIHKIDDIEFPHHYRIDKENNRVRLCLYHPKKFEWDRGTSIAENLIPWTCEWLFYYELWLGNGVWYGGGEHPEVLKNEK